MTDYTKQQVDSYCQLFNVKPPETASELLEVKARMRAHDQRIEDAMYDAEMAEPQDTPGW